MSAYRRGVPVLIFAVLMGVAFVGSMPQSKQVPDCLFTDDFMHWVPCQ